MQRLTDQGFLPIPENENNKNKRMFKGLLGISIAALLPILASREEAVVLGSLIVSLIFFVTALYYKLR